MTKAGGTGRSLVLLSGLALMALAVLVGLGLWQVRRGAEKTALLDTIRARSGGEAIALPAAAIWPTLCVAGGPAPCAAEPPEFQRVRLEGRFVGARAGPVRVTLPAPRNARELGGLGFWWFAPFELSTGGVVLVNRGFVPAGRDGRAPALAMPDGPQALVGWLRRAEARDLFAPADDLARGELFTRDPAVIGRLLGLAAQAPFLVDLERTGDATVAPVGVEAATLIQRIPNNHTGYALTWFGLAATLVGVFIAFVFARGRKDATSQ